MELSEFLKKYKRPEPKRSFDQFYATEETIKKRIELISDYSNLYTIDSIIFLGDDDLTSVFLGLNSIFKKILVLDIDEEILNLIETISKENNLNIKTLKYDLRNPLNIIYEEIKKFCSPNFIFFDPPYTPNGARIWLIRALEILLGKGRNKKRKSLKFLKNKFIFMCYGYTDKSPERGMKVQKIIDSLGLIIQEKFRKFNKYTGAETINNESDLYVLQPTPFVNLTEIDKLRTQHFKDKIYTWEN